MSPLDTFSEVLPACQAQGCSDSKTDKLVSVSKELSGQRATEKGDQVSQPSASMAERVTEGWQLPSSLTLARNADKSQHPDHNEVHGAVCVRACVHGFARVCMCACMGVHVCACVGMRVYVCTCVHVRARVCLWG